MHLHRSYHPQYRVEAHHSYYLALLIYITIMYRGTKLVILNFCAFNPFSNLNKGSKNTKDESVKEEPRDDEADSNDEMQRVRRAFVMGSTEEPNKPVTFYDSSSSPNQPLLSKPPEDPQTEPKPDPTQYLQISYNYGPRPFKDLPFVILFLLFVLCTFGFGLVSVFHRNTHYSNLSSFSYNSNSSSCIEDSLSEQRKNK